MKKLLFAALAAVTICLACAAQNTTRKGLKPQASQTEKAAPEAELEAIAEPEAHIIDINGYDKPLRSRRETFFATNNGKQDVGAIAFTIRYYDNKQRMLHSASHNIKAEIPAGETRQLSVPSWDKQLNFYYSRSAAPKSTTPATPYDVTITIDTLYVK